VNVNNEFIVGVPIEEDWKAAREVDKRRRSGTVNCDFGLAVGLNAIISGVGQYYSGHILACHLVAPHRAGIQNSKPRVSSQGMYPGER
jgi:hypothetical protein